MKRASVTDVARAAGVSTATVSRVINTPERVAEETRNKVLKAVADLNYVRSATALSFKVRQTGNILVMVTNIGSIYYSEVFEGLQREAEENGYAIIIASPPTENFSRAVSDRLRSGRVDGIVVLEPTEIDKAEIELLADDFHGTPPLVGFAEQRGQLNYPHVYIDNRKATADIVDHLVAAGHTRIGHVSGPPGYPVTIERIAGLKTALSAAGLSFREDFVLEGGFRTTDGRRAARELLALDDRPTALFCANDEVAMGLISELHEAGIKVPQDISVIGFDDICTAEAYLPGLTTIHQPRHEIGASAMALLLEVMTDPATPVDRVREIGLHLVERASVAPPKNR